MKIIYSTEIFPEEIRDLNTPVLPQERKKMIDKALEGASLEEVEKIAEYILINARDNAIWKPSQS